MLLSRRSFTAIQQIKKNKMVRGMKEPMEVSRLPRGFANYPGPYLAKWWSLVKGLSCQQAVTVCVTDETWQCPCFGLSPQLASACCWGGVVALPLPQAWPWLFHHTSPWDWEMCCWICNADGHQLRADRDHQLISHRKTKSSHMVMTLCHCCPWTKLKPVMQAFKSLYPIINYPLKLSRSLNIILFSFLLCPFKLKLSNDEPI